MTILLMCALLLLPVASWAADIVCGTDVQLCRYIPSSSLAKVTPTTCKELPEADPPVTVTETCTAITDTATAQQQRAFLNTPANRDIRKLRVVGGLVVLKEQAVLDAIAALDAATAAEMDEVDANLDSNDACNATSLQNAIDKINNQRDIIQADIDAVTTLPTAKTALTTANTRLTAIDKNIAQCLFVILKKTGIR
jgi:hypothetical protein